MKISHDSVTTLRTIGIFWDLQNVPCKTEKHLAALMTFSRRFGIPRHRYVYAHWRNVKELIEQTFSIEEFKCRNVPTLYDNQADLELKKDFRAVLRQDDLLKAIILISCDGDFGDILEEAKQQGKQVIVVSTSRKQSVSKKLSNRADQVVYLDELERDFSLPNAA